ncbi:MAG: tetratricopeptide repeat protein [Chitinophagales bacterium]
MSYIYGMATRKKSSARTQKSSKSSKPWWQNRQINQWLIFSIIVTFIAYLPSLSNGITYWDDNMYVTENPMIFGFGSENLKAIFTQPIAGNYHPVTMLSLALNYQFSGINPFGYHLVNLLLHLLNVGLVFYFVWLLSKGKKWVAFITAILFGIHPMHVESVAWIAERKDVLYAFFFLPSLIAYIRYIKTHKWSYFVVGLLLFTLALFSKPAAIILPLMLFLFDFWFKRPLNIKTIAEKIPFFILAFLFSYLTLQAQSAMGAVVSLNAYTPFTRFMAACYGFSMYIIKMIVPHQLAVYYPYPLLNDGFPAFYYIFPVLSVAIGVFTLYSLRFTKTIFFGMLFYLINLILVLQLVTVGGTIMSERYTYIPYIGLFFIVGWAYLRLTSKFKKYRMAFTTILAIYTLLMGIFTWNRCEVWKDSMTLWTDSIEKMPNVIAYNNRGELYFETKEYDLALKDVDAAAILNPSYMETYKNRGLLYSITNQFDQATQNYSIYLKNTRNATRREPVLNWRGIAQLSLNRYDGALKDFNESLELNPQNGHVYFNRSRTHRALGNRKAALEDAQKAQALGVKVERQYIEGLE